MNIENKTVLVTGSTDGVSRLVARRLADRGARVLIHGRDRTRGEQLLKEIRAADHGSAAFLPADFSSLAEVRRLADTVRQECERPRSRVSASWSARRVGQAAVVMLTQWPVS
jgi:NAD(P)-dependent dehydrogenase (short-subunit alcohol dehydrogenase family)